MNLRLTLAQLEEHNSKLKNYLMDVNIVFVGMLLLLIRICAPSYNAYWVTLVWWPSFTTQKISMSLHSHHSTLFVLQIVEAVYEPVPEGIYSEKVTDTISR